MIEKMHVQRFHRVFDHWYTKYSVEQAKIDFFNKTMICIKNNLAMRAFRTLTLHALKGRLKKRADVHRYTSMLKRGLG